MSGRILPFRSSAHQVVDALLPWYVNGTLNGEETEYVRLHLGQCARCRQEVDWLRELYAACAAEALSGGASVPERLRRQLARRAAERNLPTRSGRVLRRSNAWTWGAVAALLVVVSTVAAVLQSASAPTLYHTLGVASAPARASGALIVVFDPATSEAEMRRILREADARLVDGPTRANAYVLDVPASRRRDAIDALRREAAVVLVELLGPGDSAR